MSMSPLANRPSQYSLCVLRLPRTSFASSSSQCNGYSSLPVPMCGCSMFGTQVKPKSAFVSGLCVNSIWENVANGSE